MMQPRRRDLLALLAAISILGCRTRSDDVTLQGSGGTFPAPVYKRWFLDYYKENPSVRVNYSPIGSGAGIRQFTAGLVSFGASDAGMSEKEVARVPKAFGGVLLLPMTAGLIVLSYDLPGIVKPVRLSRSAYVKIFLREITNWNDEQIARNNPGVNLPDRPITVVTRADSSGTTYAFTSHMAAVSKAIGVAWTPGVEKSVPWKESIAAQGNDGVAALIQLTPGAIGYVEFGYAELTGLPMAALENQSHRFILPDKDGRAGEKALEGAAVPEDLQIKVSDPTSAEAYPIVTYTWILSRKHYDDPGEANALKTLWLHCLDDSQQQVAQELGYVKLPSAIVARLRAAIGHINASP
ncbi:MAG: phosphate ABC transporter substrate-binding protein PstS [Polyangiaceae bacterium]|jgi:phosphate transport system substrate-binding protein